MSGIRSTPVGNPDLVAHTGFILAEDEAIKKYLTGLRVPTRPGESGTTEVGVWFRYPESERNLKYPFITLDLLDVAPAFDLWTSDYQQNTHKLYQPSVSPALPTPNPGMGYSVRNFLPFRLTYQVAVHCRSSLHDRFLLSRFVTDVFPPRPFWLGVDADNTWRRTELLSVDQSDITETTESGNKRIFRKVYTVSVQAEVPQDAIVDAWPVLRVYVNLYDQEWLDDLFNPNLPVADFDNTTPPQASATAQAANAAINIS